MSKGELPKLKVKRINSSPYFAADFHKFEADTIFSITGAQMLDTQSSQLASVLITNTHTDVTSITSEELGACQLMIHPNSGHDNFSSDFISSASFPIILGNPIRAQAVTNFILSSLFSHYSSVPHSTTWNKDRKWPRKLLSELNVLIMGQGHVGNLLAKSLAPLVASLNIYDPYTESTNLNLKNIDVLIPACSLNKKNHHFINEAILLELNSDFLLINAARGSLVNTNDLLKVLALRPKAFAVLDVFEKEPADFTELLKVTTNLALSSHVAGVYKNIDSATALFEAQTILDFIKLDQITFEKKYQSMILQNKLRPNNFLI
ncbi:MAG: NAD(P)-dependent oxidoreductase [Bacteriovorax sp.]|nr:NAD(P)-dependent oxidoreductase [Bacteriovorax sp.]